MLPGHRRNQGTEVDDLDSWKTDQTQVQQGNGGGGTMANLAVAITSPWESTLSG